MKTKSKNDPDLNLDQYIDHGFEIDISGTVRVQGFAPETITLYIPSGSINILCDILSVAKTKIINKIAEADNGKQIMDEVRRLAFTDELLTAIIRANMIKNETD